MPRTDSPDRYSRQTLFTPIGDKGQHLIRSSTVVVVGCGALGSVSSALMARAGVGRLRIVDRDFVDTSNLQRQFLFDEDDVREMRPKAIAAAARLSRANSDVEVEPVVADVNPDNAVDLLAGATLILDGTDNFETRFLINDVSVRHDIPWIYTACLGSYGLMMNVLPGDTACLRCLMESAPPPGSVPTCDTAGVIGPIVSVIAGLQAAEALKYLSGNRDAMTRDLLSVDVWSGLVTRMEVPKSGGRRRCETCDGLSFEYLAGRGGRSVTLCGRNSVQVMPEARGALDLADLAARLSRLDADGALGVVSTRFLLRFSVDDLVVSVFPDGRAIVTGTRDPAVARGV